MRPITAWKVNLLPKSPYSVRMRENTDQKKLCIWTLFTQFMVHVLRWIMKFLPVEMAKLLGNSFIEKPDQLCTFD